MRHRLHETPPHTPQTGHFVFHVQKMKQVVPPENPVLLVCVVCVLHCVVLYCIVWLVMNCIA